MHPAGRKSVRSPRPKPIPLRANGPWGGHPRGVGVGPPGVSSGVSSLMAAARELPDGTLRRPGEVAGPDHVRIHPEL